MNNSRRASGQRLSAALAAFVLIQTVAAIFFGADAAADLLGAAPGPHSILEALVALALILGIIFGTWQLRLTLERMRRQDRALDVARGSLAAVIDTQFDAWGLTAAERDVAFLALKGLDVAEIAAIRRAAAGTVRAQLAHVYAKSGVSGRAQFAAWFVEDLLQEGLPQAAAR